MKAHMNDQKFYCGSPHTSNQAPCTQPVSAKGKDCGRHRSQYCVGARPQSPFAAAAPVVAPAALDDDYEDDEVAVRPRPRPRLDADGRLTNSTPAGLATALRNRAARDGVPVVIRQQAVTLRGAGAYSGWVGVKSAKLTHEELSTWARSVVAPAAMAGLRFNVMGAADASEAEEAYPLYKSTRVFGTLEDYLSAALRLGEGDGGGADGPDADRDDDWGHWAGTVTPELAAALENTADMFCYSSDCTAGDVLAAVAALLTPAARTT